MTVSGIQGYGASPYTNLFGTEVDEAAKKKAAAEAEAQKKADQKSAGAAYPTTKNLQDLAAIAAAAMESMGIGKGGSVTFGQISAYKERQEKDYSDKLQKDLEALGVAKDIKFQLKLGSNGKMEVVSDHPDKAKVQKYFDDNPAMVKKYKEIQSLADLESARKAMQVNPTDLRKRIQVEAMATWWDQSGGASSSIADFNGGDMAFYKGVNKTV
ncbi:MAG: hypothetical protein RRY29_01975 [Desulfovibrionaceae bacterium]